jgi:FkbM family methyltransferase
MTSTITLAMVDGARIVVPDSLSLITPYVLREQGDWFEDEIKFVRRLLKPGQKAIDIGANYGVFTLSMAQAVGAAGRVWAFEPASSTASLLGESISVNGFAHVVLERSALSNACGSARLSLNENSELNAIVPGNTPSSASETVPVVTLDECMDRHGWRDIEFVKIDAEGQEANILKGGKRFFAELSPLVQYEIRAGSDVHMELVQEFAALGYDSYRLVPGLDFLVPIDTASTPDAYLLNLFCCKRDCAERLSAKGFLSARGAGVLTPEPKRFEAKERSAYGWRRTIARLPYGARLASRWEQADPAGDRAEVEEALAFYARSQDAGLSPPERFGALEASFHLLRTVCERQPSGLRRASLARVARDYGARLLAVSALQQLSNDLLKHHQADMSEPFLAPGKRFDSVIPGEPMVNWVLAAVLEEYERLASFSSFYTGVSARKRLELVCNLGFASAEMERRLRLLQERFGGPVR